jgi:hypothetical protein
MAALAACPDSVTDDGAGGRSETPSAGGGGAAPSWGTSACGSCVEKACASSVTTCAADPGCAAWLECVRACPLADGDLAAGCAQSCTPPTSASGIAAEKAFTQCRLFGAGATCADCGGAGGAGGGHPILDQICSPSTAPDACDKCQAESCCQTPCGAACDEVIACGKACPDWACREKCFTGNPEGFLEIRTWLACATALCHVACPNVVKITGCMQCAVDECPEPFADCWADANCFLNFFCGRACPDFDAACQAECDKKHPTGLFEAFLLCAAERCPARCQNEPP